MKWRQITRKPIVYIRARDSAGRETTILVEEGKVAEALALPGVESAIARGPVELLAVTLAWQRAGDSRKADEWAARAAKEMAAHGSASRSGGILLSETTAPDRARITALHMDIRMKAVLLAVLARKFPAEAAWLNGLATRLNCTPEFPFHLVRSATQP